MKTHDKAGRRFRFSPPVDDGSRLEITPLDIQALAFIRRHGGRLPTSFIPWGSHQWRKQRLAEFYHKGFLKRPKAQTRTLDPEKNELVHELTDTALEILKRENLLSEHDPSPNGAFQHQLMGSCISASFEHNAIDAGFTYTPQSAVLEKAGQSSQVTFDDGDTARPDEVFMLHLPTPFLCFAEWDRGTEATRSDKYHKQSWTRKIKFYKKLLGNKLTGEPYKKFFKADGPALLFVITISQAKQDGILDVVADEYPKGCDKILVTHFPQFATDEFKPPKKLELLSTSWARHGHGPVQFIKRG